MPFPMIFYSTVTNSICNFWSK